MPAGLDQYHYQVAELIDSLHLELPAPTDGRKPKKVPLNEANFRKREFQDLWRVSGWRPMAGFRSCRVGQVVAGVRAMVLRWSLRRLWVAAISFHSACAAARPRRVNPCRPWAVLICPNTGSMIHFRLS